MRGGTATGPDLVREAPAWPARRARVLVIDEDVIVRAMLARYLPRMGHDAVAVRSCREACALLERESWSAVVMSVVLPGGTSEKHFVVFREISCAGGDSADLPLPRLLPAPFHLADLAEALRLVGATPSRADPLSTAWRD